MVWTLNMLRDTWGGISFIPRPLVGLWTCLLPLLPDLLTCQAGLMTQQNTCRQPWWCNKTQRWTEPETWRGLASKLVTSTPLGSRLASHSFWLLFFFYYCFKYWITTWKKSTVAEFPLKLSLNKRNIYKNLSRIATSSRFHSTVSRAETVILMYNLLIYIKIITTIYKHNNYYII